MNRILVRDISTHLCTHDQRRCSSLENVLLIVFVRKPGFDVSCRTYLPVLRLSPDLLPRLELGAGLRRNVMNRLHEIADVGNGKR